jgi:hypothetical protein
MRTAYCALRTILRHRITGSDECAGSSGVERYHREKWTGHCGCDSGGERDGHRLAELRDRRVLASEEAIVRALEGDYRPEHLFTLRQSLESYRHYRKLIEECDRQLRELLEISPAGRKDPGTNPTACRNCSHAAAQTSVFRPGTFGNAARSPRNTSSARASSTWYDGIQYTPVDSIATVTVPKRRTAGLATRSSTATVHLLRADVDTGCIHWHLRDSVTRTQAPLFALHAGFLVAPVAAPPTTLETMLCDEAYKHYPSQMLCGARKRSLAAMPLPKVWAIPPRNLRNK